MPFTHSYSSSAIAARANQNRGPPNLGNGSTSSISNTVDANTADSPSTSDNDSSSRSRLFSSGRKSPDPFRRFRRLSSSNALNIATAPAALDDSQSFDSQQSYKAAYTDTRIPLYPNSNARAASPAPLETPRSAPPPLPSSTTKPTFLRPKRTKSSSISVLTSGLGLRSRDATLDASPNTETRRRHRKSASLSGSDVDLSTLAIDSQRAITPQPLPRPASPAPSLSGTSSPLVRPAATSHPSASSLSKQHKQAWYQAQQKTIELDNPNNRGALDADSETAKLFPLNVAVPDRAERGISSPAQSRSPRPVVETFLSEEEMSAAGIQVIRRRADDPATSTPASSQDSQGLQTPRSRDQATLPAMPARLYGADQPDFLEYIDSPAESKQHSPRLDGTADPPQSSASMQDALSPSHTKSSSGSISASSSGSTDYVPFSANDASSAHNGSTTSLGSGSKHSFSFAKLRRAGVKQNAATSSPRSSAPNSSNEDVSGNRTFLFPSRAQQRMQQQQQHYLGSNGDTAAPGSLKPGPGSSASPFLNKHSATVGRASGSISAGHTAKNGLAQVFNGGSSSAATIGPSSSAYRGSASNGLPPPKPPKPKPSLLAAFPRSGGSNRSLSGSISAPNTAPLETEPDTLRRNVPSQQGTLQPPASAGAGAGFYRSIAHSRSQEAVAEARLEAEALRASAGTPLPPPRRLNPSRAGGMSTYSQQSSAPMGRTTSGGAGGGVVGALGQVGQLGAAMGRKGWDFMKTLQTNTAGGGGVLSGRSDGGSAPGYRTGGFSSSASAAAENEPTRQWLALLEAPDSTRRPSSGIFGAPLKDAVLRSRLSSLASESSSTEDHLGVPDLGSEFSASFIHSPGATPRASVAGSSPTDPLSREQARCLYLPRLVVRCIESLEKWGPSEEGIYRISGRSSHTSKLRLHFSDPRNDLRLDEISPADLDINSVCSVLKSYLRELPEPLIPLAHSKVLDQAVARLLADPEGGGTPEAKSGKATDARAAQLAPESVADELAPLMRQLPVHNWYLLRELSWHLGMLSQPEVVRSTKMPISNLTLVLAPTVSLSLALLQVLVRHRAMVFAGPVAGGDVGAVSVSAAAVAAKVGSPAKERASPPPRPAKPERLSPASKLPVLVRKRASSMGLGALLSSPTRSRASPVQSSPQPHRRTPSTTPSLELPDFIAASSPAPDAYSRPSTSLGHFAAPPNRVGATSSSRDLTALGLDDATPIARYYARSPHRMPASSPNLAHLTTSPMLSDGEFDPPGGGKSGRTSALDRPRPPTSSSASFFAGRSRRTDSVSVLGGAMSASGSSGSVGEGISPLRITKRGTVGRDGDPSASGDEDVKGRVERYLQSGPRRG